MGKFSVDIANWVAKVKVDADLAVKKIAIEVMTRIVMRSPVGNPELWAQNAIAAQYNNEVAIENARLRSDPANLDRRGRLKRGRKINDSMDIKSPDGYVGGRFRGNWQLTIGSPATDQVDRVDAGGGLTIAIESKKLDGFKAGESIFITNNLPYGGRLEFESWSKQAPAGMVRVTLAEIQQIVDDSVKDLKESK